MSRVGRSNAWSSSVEPSPSLWTRSLFLVSVSVLSILNVWLASYLSGDEWTDSKFGGRDEGGRWEISFVVTIALWAVLGVDHAWRFLRWIQGYALLETLGRWLMGCIKGKVWLRCFYCNEDQMMEEADRNKAWLCNKCLSNNNAADAHAIVEDDGTTSGRTAAPPRAGSIFCHTCEQNQQLIIRLLAEYNPGNDEYYNETVDSYKEWLEKVYPPVCGACLPRLRRALRHCDVRVKKTLMNQSLANWKPPVTKPTSQKPTLEYTCIWTVFTSLLLLTSVTFIVILLYGVIFPISFRCSDELASQQIPASGVGTFFCLYRVPMMEPKNRSLCIKIGLPALAHFNAISSLSLLLDPFAFVRRQSTTLWIDKQTYRWAQVRLVLTRTILEYMLATQVSPLLSWAANLSLLVVTCESSWASWCSIRPHVRSSTGRLPTDLAAAKESSLAGRTTSSQHRIDDEIDHLADIFRPSGRPPARSEARLGAHSFGTNTDAKSLEKFVEARRTFWKRMHLAQHVTGSCAALQLLQLFAWRRVNFFTFVPVSIVLHVALLAVLVMCSLYSSSQRNLSSLTGSLRSAIWMCLLRVTWLIVAKFYRVYCENTDFHQWMRDSEVAQVLGLEFLRWVETGAVALYAYMWILLEVKDDAHGS